MGMMLPDDLVWIIQKLGYDWPDLDEEEIFKAATLTRELRRDMEDVLQTADQKIATDVATALDCGAGLAYVNAWTTNRTQNIQRLVDHLDPIAAGIDVGGGVVIALKTKTILQVTIDALTLIPLLLNPLTGALAIARIMATRVTMGLVVDAAVSEAVTVLKPIVIDPLAEEIPALVQSVLGAPEVEDTGIDPTEISIDEAAIEEAEGIMEQCELDIDRVYSGYLADIGDLKITG